VLIAGLAVALVTLAITFIKPFPGDPKQIENLISTFEPSDDPNVWENTCTALQQIAKQSAAKAKIQRKLVETIKQGTANELAGAALCVAQEGFFTPEEAKAPLEAIEERSGTGGALCEQTSNSVPADRRAIYAVRAEYTFPSATGKAPDFLIGVIKNCSGDEFSGARDTALHHLDVVFRAKHKNDQVACNKDLADKLRTLRQFSDSVRQDIDKCFVDRVSSPCQEE